MNKTLEHGILPIDYSDCIKEIVLLFKNKLIENFRKDVVFHKTATELEKDLEIIKTSINKAKYNFEETSKLYFESYTPSDVEKNNIQKLKFLLFRFEKIIDDISHGVSWVEYKESLTELDLIRIELGLSIK